MKKRLFLATLIVLFLLLSAFALGKLSNQKNRIIRLAQLIQHQSAQMIEELLRGATPGPESYSPVEEIPVDELTVPDLILLGARREVINGTRYDASYASISYPGGDVSPHFGACTDIVIRAFRHAGIDLQELIHEDMKENFHLYPPNWGLDAPDSNIDHRRVPNQICFFTRYGLALPLEVEGHLDEWRWGDVVYWRFPNGRDHCGVISDRTGKGAVPLVIHNAGIAREEDCLFKWEIVGHFRYPVAPGDAG